MDINDANVDIKNKQKKHGQHKCIAPKRKTRVNMFDVYSESNGVHRPNKYVGCSIDDIVVRNVTYAIDINNAPHMIGMDDYLKYVDGTILYNYKHVLIAQPRWDRKKDDIELSIENMGSNYTEYMPLLYCIYKRFHNFVPYGKTHMGLANGTLFKNLIKFGDESGKVIGHLLRASKDHYKECRYVNLFVEWGQKNIQKYNEVLYKADNKYEIYSESQLPNTVYNSIDYDIEMKDSRYCSFVNKVMWRLNITSDSPSYYGILEWGIISMINDSTYDELWNYYINIYMGWDIRCTNNDEYKRIEYIILNCCLNHLVNIGKTDGVHQNLAKVIHAIDDV